MPREPVTGHGHKHKNHTQVCYINKASNARPPHCGRVVGESTRATGSQIDSQRQGDAGGSSQPHAQPAARDMDANDYYLMDLNGFLHVK